MAEWDYCLELSKQTQLPAVPGEDGEGQGQGSQGESQERAALAKRCGGWAELEDVNPPPVEGAEGIFIPLERSSEFARPLPAVGKPGGAGSAPGEVSVSQLPAEGRLAPSRKKEFGVRDPPLVPLIIAHLGK